MQKSHSNVNLGNQFKFRRIKSRQFVVISESLTIEPHPEIRDCLREMGSHPQDLRVLCNSFKFTRISKNFSLSFLFSSVTRSWRVGVNKYQVS